MVIGGGYIKRKVESIVGEWLREDEGRPVWELKIGLLSSVLVGRNLHLDPRRLFNGDNGGGLSLSTSTVVVDQIVLTLSYFSSPAFSFDVSGLHVSLHLQKGALSKPLDVSLDDYHHSFLLPLFDPQGSALHQCFHTMFMSAFPKTRLKDSITNLLLSHCSLHFHHLRLHLHFPLSEQDSCSWSCYSTDLTLRSSHRPMLSLFPAFFLALLLLPFPHTEFTLQAKHLQLGLDTKHHTTSLLNCFNPRANITIKHLRLVNLLLSLPQINLSFSPAQLQTLLPFTNLVSIATKHTRSGRLLWKIARFKIHNALLPPKYVLYNLVLAALLWLRLVKEYQTFLTLIGYPEHGHRMPSGAKSLRAAQEQWQRISHEVKTHLPVEAVASARRVARQRAASKTPSAQLFGASPVKSRFSSFWNILLPLFVLWGATLKSLKFIWSFVFPCTEPSIVDRLKLASAAVDPWRCFHLSIGKVSATVSLDDDCRLSRKANSKERTAKTDLISFFLFAKGFLFTYEEGIFEQYTSFSMGSLKMTSASITRSAKNETGLGNNHDLEDKSRENQAGSKAIAWGKSALNGCHSEIEDIGYEAIPDLKELSGEMELVWNQMMSRFQGIENHRNGNPWAICSIQTSLAYEGIKGSDPGLLKCNFMVGKLNFALDYSTVQSIATLMDQVQCALLQFNDSLDSSKSFHDLRKTNLQKINSSDTLNSTVKGLKIKLFNLLPDKHVQVSGVVAGPRVQISLKNAGFSDRHLYPNGLHAPDVVNFIIDVHSTYCAVWPTAIPNLAPGEHQRPSDDFESELFNLQENVIGGGFHESANVEYVSRGQISLYCYLRLGGLSAYFENILENDQMQVLLFKPVTVKFPSVRDYLYSFGRSVVASSGSLHGVMSGATGLFYMDELSVISQFVESLFIPVLVPASSYSVCRNAHYQQMVLENQTLETVFANEEIHPGSSDGVTLALECDFISTRVIVELLPFDIILHNSRNVTDKSFLPLLLDTSKIQVPGFAEPSFNGIWLSAQRSCIDISVGEAKVEVVANVGGFHAVLFKQKIQNGNADKFRNKDAILHSVDCLYEASLSSCSFTLLLDCPNESNSMIKADNASFYGTPKGLLSGRSLIINSQSSNLEHSVNDVFKPDVSDAALSHWLLLDITAGVFFMGPLSIKDDVLGVNVVEKLQLSVSVGGEFQSILMEIQGGIIMIDVSVLVRFAHCFTPFCEFVKILLYMEHLRKSEVINESFGTEHSEEPGQRNSSPAYAVTGKILEACSVDLTHFSLVLISQDDSGLLREIIGRVTFVSRLWLEDRKQKFLFNLSHLEILSQYLYKGARARERINQMPHFSSVRSSYEPVLFNNNSPGMILRREKVVVLSKDASCSKPLVSVDSSSSIDSSFPVAQTSGNCILERLTSSISAEKLFLGFEDDQHCETQGWIGHSSISGLNLTLSLSEIKILMAVVESLSEVSGKGAANNVVEKTWSSADQISEINLETALPEGAIVAIQDVHQHMYVTVENVENKYRVAGAVHYSTAGRQALFRVKWQKQKRWKFSTPWFSLVSLFAQTASGDPLRLNYSTSSSFMDISSSNDSACALWKTVSHKHEGYEDNTDLRPLCYLSRNTFYLVNKKNDCAAAFVHGAFEFVKKPGNLFKFKIFHGISLTRDMPTSESHSLSINDLVPVDAQDVSDQVQIVPCITLTVEKVSFTIVHELSDARDKLPLLRGSIDDIELTVQVLPLKTRVISTSTTMLYYFDAHNLIWRELVQPIEICVYWRSITISAAEKKSSHGMHSRLYFRMQELEISLTELSLDILLYLIGKLDIAGPFAVNSSAILANCCKVENQLELDLLCHFDNSQSARVGRDLSAYFFLRDLVDQPLEASCAVVYLEIPGVSATSSIRVPLARTQVFAWRTCIKSIQDSQTHPGPFIVFDISKNVEEGLSFTVSPLLRIRNQSGFPVELRIQRAGSTELESASVLLKEGDTVDDCVAAFDAISLAGGPKKALRSLGVGNFVFSFRPEIESSTKHFCNASSVNWSDNLEGGKAVPLCGVINKFSYQFRKALSVDTRKYSFSTTGCSVISGNAHVAKMHFLVQSIARNVPIMQPNNHPESKISPIAFQEQKEILLLPTVRVSNLLESDIDVLLSETEISTAGILNINQATVPFGLTVDLYPNPAVIFFTITLTMFGASCKPVNCGQWLKKMNKKKDGIQFLDIDLEFCKGQYCGCLRLARSEKGMLEAIVFTRYTLRNDTEFPIFCSAPNLKPLPWDLTESYSTTTAPHLGSSLPPKSIRSWFMKSSKLSMTLFDEESSESTLDLDALSGRSETSFTKLQSGFIQSFKLGISMGPLMNKFDVPAQLVSLVPRYVVSNESEEHTFVRQCFLEEDFGETLSISSKQKKALSLRVGSRDIQDITVFDKLLRKHKVSDDDFSAFVQFRPNESILGWSGPVCVASLGRFFLKFRRSVESPVHQPAHATREDRTWEFAAVHVVEEASTFVLNYYKPPDIALPYRIENHLCDASITYYQKDTFVPETLATRKSVYYVWDDLTRPRKLVVKINGIEMLREISLDKLRPWKPFLRLRQQRERASKLPSYSRGTNVVSMNGINVENLGYEVRPDGPTRVLRICHSPGSQVGDRNFHSSKMIQLRVSYFTIRLLQHSKQNFAENVGSGDLSGYRPIVVGRLMSINLDSIILDQRKYNQFRVQAMNVDEKWDGAPFAAMLRRHFSTGYEVDDSILSVVFVLYPSSSTVREVKYSSIVLQPIDLNLDEETLMKIVSFWRTSLSTNTESQQYYFDHFEVHPVKIIASFLPEDSYSSYNSGHETLRSLLHSVIKIPAIKNLVVELNGVLVTHALVTTRELLLRCGQHYSWYAMRAIYIAKGSRLLPPAFASVFDDLASSSLDVFFDPSSSLFNVRGLTLGTFKLISKCIENKGISGTRRYFGDLSKTFRNAGSNILFAVVTEVTDSVLKGAESNGLNGMLTGFHHGILKLAMEPSVLGTAFLEGGPDRKIKLDRSPGVDELYIEGYLQAMLDTLYKQEYLRVRVIDDQVILKNLPPNSSLIIEIMDRVKDFLVSKTLLKGDYSTMSRPLRHLRGENEWRLGPTVLTLCEHLFVSFAIRMLRKQTNNAMGKLKPKGQGIGIREEMKASSGTKRKLIWRWGIGKFVLSAAVAYIDGRLCRCIPNPVARRIVSGFLLSFLDNDDTK